MLKPRRFKDNWYQCHTLERLYKQHTAPAMPYSIDESRDMLENFPGHDPLINQYTEFVRSNFNKKDPSPLTEEQRTEISLHFTEAKERYTPGTTQLTSACNQTQLELLVNAVYNLNTLTTSSQEMYSLLATLATVANDHIWFETDILDALMTLCIHNECTLIMMYSLYFMFRTFSFSGMLYVQGNPMHVLFALLKPDTDNFMYHKDRVKLSVPTGGVWFWKLDNAHAAHIKNPTRFLVAWDKDPKIGSKCYGLYANVRVFMDNLKKCDLDKRWAYEVIPPNTICNGYTDVEFYGPADPLYQNGWHSKIDMILAHIDQKVLRLKGYHAIFKLQYSSRPEGNTIKHSFHIIVLNLPFSNNHDGTMKKFFEVTEDMGDEWYTVFNDKRKTIMDPKVYSERQCFRMALCSKKGKLIPLKPLSDNFRQMEFDDNEDSAHLAALLVCNKNPQYSLVPSTPQAQRAQASTARKIEHKPRDWNSNMFSKKEIEILLRDHGDTVSKVTKITKHFDRENQYWAQCDQRKQLRPCIATPGCTHNSNNCILRLTFVAPGNYSVEHRCLSDTCKGRGYQLLGFARDRTIPTSEPMQESPFTLTEIPLDHLTKQLNQFVAGIHPDHIMQVRDILARIALAYNNDAIRAACIAALPALWQNTTVQTITCDPLEELQTLYEQDVLFSLTGCNPNDIVRHTLRVDEKYCLPHIKPLPFTHRVLALKAQPGLGKSETTRRFIKDVPEMDACIFVVPRTMLGNQALQLMLETTGLPWRLASSIDGEIDPLAYPYTVTQIETLGRYRLQNCMNMKVALIMDEINSNLRQLQSSFGDSAMVQYNLQYLCEEADYVLALDGYLDQLRLDVLERYTKEKAYVIHNTFKRKLDQHHEVAFTDDVQRTIDFGAKLIADGVPIQICFYNKKFAEMVIRTYRTLFGDTKRIELYTSDNKWNPADDVNKVFSSLDVLAHTSTIDVGVSFALPHFGYCITFVNVRTPLGCEIAAQMDVRCRTIYRHLTCIENSYIASRNCDLQHIMDELDAKTVITSNMSYMGVQAVRHERHDTVDTCCPLLLNAVTNESVLRHSLNNFKLALATLFVEEGATLSNWIPGDMPSLAEEVKEAKKFIKPVPNQVLLDAYGDPESVIFDTMKDKDRALYASHRMIKAFRLQNLLRSEGPTLEASVQRMEAKIAMVAIGAEACLNSGRFNVNDVVMAQLQTGVRGGNLKINIVKMVMCLFEFFTGVRDPFLFTSQYQSVMQQRLGFTPDTEGASIERTSQLFDMMQAFIALDPVAHTPFRPIKQVPRIAFNQAITLINQVLCSTLTIKLNRDKTKTGSNNTCIDFKYIVEKSRIFSEQDGDVTKPILIPWNQSPPPLQEDDIFKVKTIAGRQLLAVNESFIQFRDTSDEFRPRGYTDIKPDNLNPDQTTDTTSDTSMYPESCKYVHKNDESENTYTCLDPDDVQITRAKNRLCELVSIMTFIVAECPNCKWPERFQSNGHSIQKGQSDECLLVDSEGTASCLLDVVLNTPLQYSDDANVMRFTVGDIMQSTDGRLHNMHVFQVSDCVKCKEMDIANKTKASMMEQNAYWKEHYVDNSKKTIERDVHWNQVFVDKRTSCPKRNHEQTSDVRPVTWWRTRQFTPICQHPSFDHNEVPETEKIRFHGTNSYVPKHVPKKRQANPDIGPYYEKRNGKKIKLSDDQIRANRERGDDHLQNIEHAAATSCVDFQLPAICRREHGRLSSKYDTHVRHMFDSRFNQ